jgi:thiosulfate reductase cytochrome b subunit
VQLHWLTAAFGGFNTARFIHFAGLALLAAFTVGHVIMVLLHPRAFGEMVTGGKARE